MTEQKVFLVKAEGTEAEYIEAIFNGEATSTDPDELKVVELTPSDLSFIKQACMSSMHEIKFSGLSPTWIKPKIKAYENLLKKLSDLHVSQTL